MIINQIEYYVNLKYGWNLYHLTGIFFLILFIKIPVPEGTEVDRTRRHCSVETIRGTGPSELGWSRPMSKNPLERAWPQWDQRRLSNRREQILHFDLSRKGREAITIYQNISSRYPHCPYTFYHKTKERTIEDRRTKEI